jgi:hypothetical protein
MELPHHFQQIGERNRRPLRLQAAIDFAGAKCDWYGNWFHRYLIQKLVEETVARNLASGGVWPIDPMRQLDDCDNRQSLLWRPASLERFPPRLILLPWVKRLAVPINEGLHGGGEVGIDSSRSIARRTQPQISDSLRRFS